MRAFKGGISFKKLAASRKTLLTTCETETVHKRDEFLRFSFYFLVSCNCSSGSSSSSSKRSSGHTNKKIYEFLFIWVANTFFILVFFFYFFKLQKIKL